MNSDELLLAQMVDEVCTRFDDAWQAGDRPRIGDFVAGLGDVEKRDVLRELILLDVHYRRQEGQLPICSDYTHLFAELDPGGWPTLLTFPLTRSPMRARRSWMPGIRQAETRTPRWT